MPLASCLLPIFTRKLILHDYLPDKDLVDLCPPIEPYQVTKNRIFLSIVGKYTECFWISFSTG
ncbi:hypothetical protein [Microcystis aeruginosa]|uniref:hypothetical protein n=1 Tax=Microcystis aeruginosa TaxID=1126 RepID=UPI0002EDC170